MTNRFFREYRAKDCQEIEELRRVCCEETDRARQARVDELSMHQEESYDCESVVDSNSGFTEQSKFIVRRERILRSCNSEQLWSDSRSQSTLHNSESPDHALPRFWIAARYTECCGYFRKRFSTTTCSRRTNLSLRQFKEFGILFSRIEILTYQEITMVLEREMRR